MFTGCYLFPSRHNDIELCSRKLPLSIGNHTRNGVGWCTRGSNNFLRDIRRHTDIELCSRKFPLSIGNLMHEMESDLCSQDSHNFLRDIMTSNYVPAGCL